VGYRVFVDENLDPQVALFLRMRSHDAIHVEETLGKGTDDAATAVYAREGGYAVLTSDDDFLRSERNEGLTLFYCPDETVPAAVIAERVNTLSTYVPHTADLPQVSYVTAALNP
jgi:hypothetical protein